jgi:hypothetical protein
MVTNYPQQLAGTSGVTGKTAHAAGVLSRVAARVGQVVCGLHGHDAVLHFEASRVMMRCTSCGYDTPGWEISGKGPRLRYEGDARHHMLKPRLTLRKSA